MQLTRLYKTFIMLIACALCGNLSAQTSQDLFASSQQKFHQAQYSDALNEICQAIEISPHTEDFYLLRARIYFALADYNKTIEDCYQLQRLKPNMAEVNYLRGRVCLVTKTYGCAILMFSKALEGFDDDRDKYKTYLQRALVYDLTDENSKALDDYKMALNIYEDSASALLPLARFYLKLQNKEKAMLILDKLIRNTGYSPALKLYGQLWYEDSNFAKAAEMYERYLDYIPNDAEAVNQIARANIQLNELDKACSAITQSLAIDNTNPQSYMIRGQVYLLLKYREEGCNSLFRAMMLGYIEQNGLDILDLYIPNCEEDLN